MSLLGNKSITITGSSEVWSIGVAGTLSFGNGIKIRKMSDDIGAFTSEDIDISATDTIVIRPESDCPQKVNGTLYVSETDYYSIIFVVNRYNNSIVLEDFCYGDSFRNFGETEEIPTFSRWISGDKYVYDNSTESFRLATSLESSNSAIKKYEKIVYETNIQTKYDDIDAYFDTADIVFADYAVGDSQVDTWITANVSVAGLYMTFVESTDTVYRDTVVRVQLGTQERNGRWDNQVYCGSRIIESKQLTPDSNDSKAIKYRFKVDFNNNGKDDVEIQQLNVLSSMKIFEKEGGNNA